MQLDFRKDAWGIDPFPDFHGRVDIAQGRAEARGLNVRKRGGEWGGG
jgi:hypothetical protein